MNDYLVKLYYTSGVEYMIFKNTTRKAVNDAILAIETHHLQLWTIKKIG